MTRPYATPVYHLYVVQTPHRNAIHAALREAGIHTGLHYPVPIHLQPCYADLGGQPGDFPHAEAAAKTCISLPIYPELPEEAPAKVAEVIRHTLRLS